MTRRRESQDHDHRLAPSIVKAAGERWPDSGGQQPSDPYTVALLAIWERRIAKREMPTGAQLADLLSANGPKALPPWLFDHLCRHLRGQTRSRPGPKTQSPFDEVAILVAVQRYGEFLAWLQKRKRSQELNGWSCIRQAEWWDGPPHERAKRMILRRFVRYRRIGIGRLTNIISSRSKAPLTS